MMIGELNAVEDGSEVSHDIAHMLSEQCYDQYAEREDTRLANAIREYICALQMAALEFGETYDELSPPDFMLDLHDNIRCDLHVV